MFSVLIAHYNNCYFFKQCYESLKKQTVQDFEIILVDDCSGDDSLERIKQLTKEDLRVKIFKNSDNKGVGYTKRKCVELATGELCGFVDPDDALMPGAIETSINAYKNHNIIATYSEFWVCDENLKIHQKFKSTKKIRNGNPYFYNVRFEVAHFFTFKREVYNKTLCINEDLSSAVDQDLYMKLYEKGDFFFIKKPLYLYRIHEKGVSQEQSKKEKLNDNWDRVLRDTLVRRNQKMLYKQEVGGITNLPKFLHKKQNTLLKKILRKLSW